jgi:helicase
MTHDYINNPKLPTELIACLQEWGISSLTEIQQLAIEAEVPVGASAIVCAPTSSGKTLVGELAVAYALGNALDGLYLVSHKALAEQKFMDFSARFSAPHWASSVTVGISTGNHEEGDINCRLADAVLLIWLGSIYLLTPATHESVGDTRQFDRESPKFS